MDPAKEDDYEFDPMDSTKIWDEDDFPLQEVGKMVLDKNVDNWHNENEMIAFSPGMLPPGGFPFLSMSPCQDISYPEFETSCLQCEYWLWWMGSENHPSLAR